ncbi:MAG TPA: hypothetical protein H9668_05510 [Firmicutes bacterium]|nr:hypothetical protein [Bacillota bacterium]
MKKLTTAVLSALLAVCMACTAWAADVPANVGVFMGEMPAAFQGKEAILEQNCKKAYAWALQLHAQEEDGSFRFGESSGTLLHAWYGMDMEEVVNVLLCQDFSGGNSTAPGAFGTGSWAALVCVDPETCEFIVLRDTPAEYFSLGGGPLNLQTGMPTTNQYWRMEDGIPVLYQQFENGYLRAEEGKSWFAEFHNKTAEGTVYVEPPQPPTAYGPIDEVSADGCTWENPLYLDSLRGDVNGDGRVDIQDVMALCKILACINTNIQPDADQLSRGNLDGDDSISIGDVMALCRILAQRAA